MPQGELTTRIKVLATAGVMLALLLAALDQTIVGTALPRIVAELNGLDRYSWLITGYLVASTVVVPIAGGLIPMLIALSVAKDQGWTSFEVLGLLAFGAAMLIAFFMIEQRVKEPIVPFTLFKNRAFAVSVLVGFFAALGMFGMIIFVPLETQGVLGVSVTNSGLLLTPMMLGLIVSSVLTGQLIPRIKHYHYLGTIGLGLVMIGLYLMAQTTTSTTQTAITIDIVLVGLGLGVTMP